MLRTSLNFSYSAEHLNIEFGVLIEDQGSLIPSKIWHSKHGVKHGGLYEMV
jgi:phosphatidylserine/phosphatidylglycerophosphate/cardiolipin synthase-like enzyme